MANTFLKAEKIISQGLGLLQRELILPRLVTRLGRDDFVGSQDDTVNVKIPAILTAREYAWRNNRASAITYDGLEELTIPVALDKHPYSGVKITDEELTLDISSWGEQVARPQIRAVAEKLESYIAAEMLTANYAESVTYTPGDGSADDTTFFRALVQARRALNEANVPLAGRVVVLGAGVEEAALQSPHLIKANEAGDDSALREATIGRVAGFNVIGGVNSVDPYFAVAFHPSAFAFANVAPTVPDGAVAGAGLTFEGLAMRWIRDYDPDHLQDRSVYSAFAGAASIEDGRDGAGDLTNENVRAVEIVFGGDS